MVTSYNHYATLNNSLSQLLNEQGYAIGSLNDLLGDFLGKGLATNHALDHVDTLPWRESVESEYRNLGAANPRRRKLRPKGNNHQHPQCGNAINDQVQG